MSTYPDEIGWRGASGGVVRLIEPVALEPMPKFVTPYGGCPEGWVAFEVVLI